MSIICEEIFDDSINPSEEEILDYAEKIGINPDTEPHLLSLAAEGLMKALPPEWKPCYDDKKKSYYYYNTLTGKSQWEHPFDNHYRSLVTKKRSDSQSFSIGGDNSEDKTFMKEDHLSFDEQKFKLKKYPIDSLLQIDSIDHEKPPLIMNNRSLEISGGGEKFLKSNIITQKLPPIKKFDSFKSSNDPLILSTAASSSSSLIRNDVNSEDKKIVKFNLNTTDIITNINDSEGKLDDQNNESSSTLLKSHLKLIKPHPDDLKKLNLQKTSDSDDESLTQTEDIESVSVNNNIKSDLSIDFNTNNNNLSQLNAQKFKYNDLITDELDSLKFEMGNRIKILVSEEKLKLDKDLQEKIEILKKEFEIEENKIKNEFQVKKNNLKIYYDNQFEQMKKDMEENFEKNKNEIIIKNNKTIEQLKENNLLILEEMKKGLKAEEELLQTEHKVRLNELKTKIKDEQDEKTEKNLLEEKYRCLKEKYTTLKSNIKFSIERKKRIRKQNSSNTTGSETEKSFSNNIENTSSNCKDPSQEDNDEEKNSLKQLPTIRKNFHSDIIKTNNILNKKDKRACSPVDNLRKQLQKLEDLEDQFPESTHSDLYHLPYPFTDKHKFEGSSELEFFRHRIHLEKDSIKMAKDSLKNQKLLFQKRQKEMNLKHGTMARHTLQQLCQEEKELTDMEVNLHRTKSLLAEKVIRLKHLETSLHRAMTTKNNLQEDSTLSDVSSQSVSSGISSTETINIYQNEKFQESSEIILSLENLNSEIRDIWNVLRKQHSNNLTNNFNNDLEWPILIETTTTTTGNPITLTEKLNNYRQYAEYQTAQGTVVTHDNNHGSTTALIERTRNLKHWLKRANSDNNWERGNIQAAL